jgi:glycerol-3-phosphate acyltransferase PlsX
LPWAFCHSQENGPTAQFLREQALKREDEGSATVQAVPLAGKEAGKRMKIALDVMGTDYGPKELVLGAVMAVKEYNCDVVLVGDEPTIVKLLKEYGADKDPRLTVRHASEVIDMHEHPGIAVKTKKDASIVVATDLLRNKECDALVSSGSTGAAVAAALFHLGRIRGVGRPTIATPIPSLTGTTVLLDSGAKVDAKPEHMLQNAIMGSVFAELMLNIKNPRVGLLNIGEEEIKGNEQTLATYPLLKEEKLINFIGNVEGRDINKGTVDVVVCDGFVGNVVLKTAEGLATAILTMVKEAIMNGGLMAKFGGLLIKPALRGLKKRLSSDAYGGALLLGVRAPFFICHGSSKANAIKNAIGVAVDGVERNICSRIAEDIARQTKADKVVGRLR